MIVAETATDFARTAGEPEVVIQETAAEGQLPKLPQGRGVLLRGGFVQRGAGK